MLSESEDKVGWHAKPNDWRRAGFRGRIVDCCCMIDRAHLLQVQHRRIFYGEQAHIRLAVRYAIDRLHSEDQYQLSDRVQPPRSNAQYINSTLAPNEDTLLGSNPSVATKSMHPQVIRASPFVPGRVLICANISLSPSRSPICCSYNLKQTAYMYLLRTDLATLEQSSDQIGV
jgi:hypothetical protein